MILSAMVLAALPFSANALQIKQTTDNGQITALVSAQEISRISLAKDRIRMVNGDPEVDITHDSKTGDIYLKPVAVPLSKPINLFISTEKGFTYQLLLMPEKAPSEQIIIRNEDAFEGSGEAQTWESSSPFHATVIKILKAVIGETDLPAGYKKEVFRNENTDTHNHLLLSRKHAITGAALQGIWNRARKPRFIWCAAAWGVTNETRQRTTATHHQPTKGRLCRLRHNRRGRVDVVFRHQ
jgi:hypothetical protein